MSEQKHTPEHTDKNEETNEFANFVNPIDPDKVAENPGLLPYAHTVGGVVIRPLDEGKIKGRALKAMDEQTDMQMSQIRRQIELLAQQAQEIQKRKEVSLMIYEATVGFEPLISHVYHLYQKANDELLLSMVAPQDWGRKIPFKRFVATVKLLADHTWDILVENTEGEEGTEDVEEATVDNV